MEKRHRIRLKNSLIAGSGGVVLCLILFYGVYTGQSHLSGWAIVALLAVFWSVNCWFIWAVGSGYSDRFKDGSLTLPQMYWAAMCCLINMSLVNGLYELNLLLLFLIMVFGIFQMKEKDYTIFLASLVVLLAIQLIIGHVLNPEAFELIHRIIIWVVYTVCVAALTSLCNSMAIIRARMHSKNEQLQEALSTKTVFLANMSHEVRTPINGVIGMLRLLQRSQLTEDQRHHANLAHSSAQSLLTMVNDILDFSKIEARQMELEEIEFNLCEQLQDIALTMGMRAAEKDLEFIIDIKDVQQSLVIGDPARLHQIFMNLLGNAVKFTRQGEIVLRCSLTEDTAGSHAAKRLKLVCSVIDTGIGIAPDNIGRIFESFTQEDVTTTRQFGGSGLGLTIAKQLCELMHGHIEVKSVVGYGTEFTFSVLLTPSDNATLLAPRINLADKRVLIVDSNMNASNNLAAQLAHWGAKVKQVYDEKSAIAALYELANDKSKTMYAMVFIDNNILCHDGVSLSTTIRQDSEFSSINLVGLLPINEEPDTAQQKQCDAYLNKPVINRDLIGVLERFYSLPQHAGWPTEGKVAGNAAKSALNSHRILLVEDNLVNQKVCEGLLDEFGLFCDLTLNGLEALEKLTAASKNNRPYTLVLMDCQMPVMDGYEATRHIRAGRCGEEYRYTPIIAITANVMEGDKEKCLNSGMSDYLPKPLEINEFSKKLTQWLGNVTLKSNVVMFSKHSYHTKPPIWDKQAALRRVGGKNERLVYLVSIFLKNLPGEISMLEEAVRQENIESIRKAAHSIKGVAGNMGTMRLMDVAKDLEELAMDGEMSRIRDEWIEIRQIYEDADRELTFYLQKSESQ